MILGNTHVHYEDVTFDQLDAGNGLYHANYLVLSDRARARAFEDAGCSLRDLWHDGYALLPKELTSDFLRPVVAGTRLAILSQFTIQSDGSLAVTQQFVSRDDLPKIDLNGAFVDATHLVDARAALCRMQTKLVCTSLRERRAAELPAALVEALLQLLTRRTTRPPAYAARADLSA
jgi:acyl-CoA thioesterase FadM